MSRETKWTLGPWGVDHDSDEVAVVMGSAIDSQCGYFTAHRWICGLEWDDDDDEAEANARLIAAAPELYDALESCMKELHFMIEKHNTHNISDNSCEYDHQTVHEASLALAKARGEQ